MTNFKPPALNFTIKVSYACNLNCTYCYVYNQTDQSWAGRPVIMSEAVFLATVNRINEYCLKSGQKNINICFHGGEPCLIGPHRFVRMCEHIRSSLRVPGSITFSIQTNGTVLSAAWIEAFAKYEVAVGISLDGGRVTNDRFRYDFNGRGTYDRIATNIGKLKQFGVRVDILCVIPFGESGVETYTEIKSTGADAVYFLFPHLPRSEVAEIKKQYGPTPIADFTIPLLDYVCENETSEEELPSLWNILRILLGARSTSDFFGNRPLPFLFIETDGSIEVLDTLKSVSSTLSSTGLNILEDEIAAVFDTSTTQRRILTGSLPDPEICTDCPEFRTCRGGHIADRYSEEFEFDAQSVWCKDILHIFRRARELIGVTPLETEARITLLEKARSTRLNGTTPET
jgi:uncharacterized protein